MIEEIEEFRWCYYLVWWWNSAGSLEMPCWFWIKRKSYLFFFSFFQTWIFFDSFSKWMSLKWPSDISLMRPVKNVTKPQGQMFKATSPAPPVFRLDFSFCCCRRQIIVITSPNLQRKTTEWSILKPKKGTKIHFSLSHSITGSCFKTEEKNLSLKIQTVICLTRLSSCTVVSFIWKNGGGAAAVVSSVNGSN